MINVETFSVGEDVPTMSGIPTEFNNYQGFVDVFIKTGENSCKYVGSLVNKYAFPDVRRITDAITGNVFNEMPD